MLCLLQPALAQEFKEKTHVSKEFSINKNNASAILAVYNINGFIKVEGYAGDKVTIEVDKTISAKEKNVFEEGKAEFKLEFEQIGDSVVAYISNPNDSRPNRRWNNEERHRIEYWYNLDFTIKVPMNMNLNVSTVNNGSVTVENVSGAKIRAHNVNGAIALTNVKGTTSAVTVNGNVDVSYLSNPAEASTYSTINGTIKVSYQPNLSADFQFKSMHGDLYTDFDNVILPANLTKNQEGRGSGTVYKLSKVTAVRVGSGGALFKFETLNGSVYIKKQS